MLTPAPMSPALRLGYAIAPGERIYAVGDVHGRCDLFDALVRLIRRDSTARGQARTKIILLGDVIDRGPQSAELVERLMRYVRAKDRFIVLKGNHEQVMAAALSGEVRALATWLRIGGRETLASWGVPDAVLDDKDLDRLLEAARSRVGADVLLWLQRLPLHHRSGQVLFVHAGIRPEVALQDQNPNDLLWIREAFLSYETAHAQLVVHGHSPNIGGPEYRHNRIGIDTGAFKSGRLTALALEGDSCWTLNTE